MQPPAPRTGYARQPGACRRGMTALTSSVARHSAFACERTA